MASTGVTIANGLTNASAEEYVIKKAVIQNSQIRYLLSDHTKFGKFALMTYCRLNEVQHIFTDLPPVWDTGDAKDPKDDVYWQIRSIANSAHNRGSCLLNQYGQFFVIFYIHYNYLLLS